MLAKKRTKIKIKKVILKSKKERRKMIAMIKRRCRE